MRAKKAGEMHPRLFPKWLKALREWTFSPLEGFDQRVRLAQLWEDDGSEDEEDEDGGDGSSDDESDDEVLYSRRHQGGGCECQP